jgi:hypothetical protein
VAGLQLSPEQVAAVGERTFQPKWLASPSQPSVFDALLMSGNVRAAWLSLNSPGWLFTEARDAFLKLAKAAPNPLLLALWNAWSTEPHDQFGGYGRSDRTTWWGRPTEPGTPKPDAIVEYAKIAKERAARKQ